MPTNAQRRETAKRKLERQLERRAQAAKRQRILTVVGTMVALAAAAVLIAVFVLKDKDSTSTTASSSTYSAAAAAAPARGGDGQLPVFKAPADLGANCKYPASGQKASRPADPPKVDKDGKVPTDPSTISVSMSTDQGNIGLILNNGEAPCTVNSVASLAQKGFF
ncbi:MAG: peptidylprolyl isomerase, partial [Mycobacterium sp.]